MVCDEMLQQVPRIARYRRELLGHDKNALSFWAAAAESLVELRDECLYEELVCGNTETGELAAFPLGANRQRVNRFLEDNKRALYLLHRGIRCDRLQFPELEEEGDVAESAESLLPLVHLANTWFIHARSLIADGELARAAEELIGVGQMGQMICCGEGFVVHYLVGCSVMGTSLSGISLLCRERLPVGVVADLSAALEAWRKASGGVATCLRVELCCHVLGELARLFEKSTLEEMVDELIDRHYPNEPMLPAEESEKVAENDGRLAWRRESILRLLEGHPAPLDKTATVRLVGDIVADWIRELQSGIFDWMAPWRQIAASVRRSRFRLGTMKWPEQLTAGFPYEYLGPGADARQRIAELKEELPLSHWTRMQPPSGAELEIARERLRLVPNAFGLLAVHALLPTDIRRSEQIRRERLRTAKSDVDACRG